MKTPYPLGIAFFSQLPLRLNEAAEQACADGRIRALHVRFALRDRAGQTDATLTSVQVARNTRGQPLSWEPLSNRQRDVWIGTRDLGVCTSLTPFLFASVIRRIATPWERDTQMRACAIDFVLTPGLIWAALPDAHDALAPQVARLRTVHENGGRRPAFPMHALGTFLLERPDASAHARMGLHGFLKRATATWRTTPSPTPQVDWIRAVPVCPLSPTSVEAILGR